jgi:hypothetical protein
MTDSLEQIRERAAAHERELSEGDLLPVSQVAAMLDMSETYVRDIPRDELPYGEFGHGHKLKRRKYRRADVDAYIEGRFAVSK